MTSEYERDLEKRNEELQCRLEEYETLQAEKMKRPLSPAETRRLKQQRIPDEVFEVINGFLIEGYGGSGKVVIKQDDIMEQLVPLLGMPREEIFAKKLLDIEAIYQEQGWEVKYSKYDKRGSLFTFEEIK
jgi:hypothetical protein